MEELKKYHYELLSRESVNIRLVRIHGRDQAGGENDPIKCSIESVSLDEKPEYTALSYTWGDPKVTKPMLLDGKALLVTTNLHSALVALRARGNSARLWIDAISINQQDDDEKSWQVAQMLRIYQQATEVVVWLGPSAEDSDTVLDKFEDVGTDALSCGILDLSNKEKEAAESLLGKAQLLAAFPDQRLAEGTTGTFENMLFRRFGGSDRPKDGIICPRAPLEALMSRAWWKRIWVLQEFSVARHVVFLCGDKAVSGKVFEAGLTFFKMQANSLAESDSTVHFVNSLDLGVVGIGDDPEEDEESKRKRLESEYRIMYRLDQRHAIFFDQRQRHHNNDRMHLLGLLLEVSGLSHYITLHATDPRDIIFALLGLSTDAEQLGIKPDYTMSVRQLYEQVAITLNKYMYNILPLCLGTDIEAAKQGEWPSWVPDWRRTHLFSKFNTFAGFKVGKGVPPLWIYDENHPGRLGVNCYVLDKVLAVEALPLSTGQSFHGSNAPNMTPPHFQSSIIQAAKFVENSSVSLLPMEKDKDSVWRTLLADQLLFDLPEGVGAIRLNDERLIAQQREVYNAIVNRNLFSYFSEEMSELIQQQYARFSEKQENGESSRGEVVSLSPKKPGLVKTFAFTANRMLSQRALITTQMGLLCLGPAHTEPGHFLALINDLDTPYVFCQVPGREGYGPSAALVGQVYVHGLMDGLLDHHMLQRRELEIV